MVRLYAKIRPTTLDGEKALQVTKPGKTFGMVFVPNKQFFKAFKRVK